MLYKLNEKNIEIILNEIDPSNDEYALFVKNFSSYDFNHTKKFKVYMNKKLSSKESKDL